MLHHGSKRQTEMWANRKAAAGLKRTGVYEFSQRCPLYVKRVNFSRMNSRIYYFHSRCEYLSLRMLHTVCSFGLLLIRGHVEGNYSIQQKPGAARVIKVEAAKASKLTHNEKKNPRKGGENNL